MSLEKIKRYIDILLYLYSNESITINQISHEFDIAYSTLSALFKKWIDEDKNSEVKITGSQSNSGKYLANPLKRIEPIDSCFLK